jgi:hypothetical protein
MNSMHSCLHFNSNFVKSIVLNGIFAGMNSPIGRNITRCYDQINSSIGRIGVSKLSNCKCLGMCSNHMDTQLVARANVLCEVMMIRDGLFEFSSDIFVHSELDDFVKSLAS